MHEPQDNGIVDSATQNVDQKIIGKVEQQQPTVFSVL